MKPRRPEDLIKLGENLILGLVSPSDNDMTRLLLSKEVAYELLPRAKNNKPLIRLFATYLDNLVTHLRIWKALNPDPEVSMNLVSKILGPVAETPLDYNDCYSEENTSMMDVRVLEAIESFKLDESQKAAVLSGVAMTKHSYKGDRIKFIWGPPGTGKTKTVACLLFSLFQLKCRTLAFAPTNIAVLQLALRLMGLLSDSLKYDSYGLGDVILFGNGERMKVDEYDDLLNVFLDYRAEVLTKCLSSFGGWKATLNSMISLLEDPEEEYRTYL